MIGTGLAQPTRRKIMQIVPKGSRCFRGFRVSRPIIFAVGSPHFSATYPWAHSWMTRLNTMHTAR